MVDHLRRTGTTSATAIKTARETPEKRKRRENEHITHGLLINAVDNKRLSIVLCN